MALSLLSEVPRLADLYRWAQLEPLKPTLVIFTCKTEVLSCGLQADVITFNAAPELLAEARADLRPYTPNPLQRFGKFGPRLLRVASYRAFWRST